ncbi:hypothetical protein D5086_007643 [Populus alba]|uniref:Uncharacterized protein n=1 Tax=Populus alba TaxID=43335 RepID=A0ACC4CPD8_POPAL
MGLHCVRSKIRGAAVGLCWVELEMTMGELVNGFGSLVLAKKEGRLQQVKRRRVQPAGSVEKPSGRGGEL